MSRRRAGRRVYSKPIEEKSTSKSSGALTLDSFSNPFARLGAGQTNLLEASEQPVTRLTQNFTLLNSLYRNNWIARRIIDAVPEDMVKNGFELESQVSPDMLGKFKSNLRKTHLQKQLLEGLRWGRLFGGAAGIIVIEGQEDMLDEPLELDSVLPGQYKGLIIADRWSGLYPESGLVQSLGDPDFGTPEYYTFSMSDTDIASGVRVHHSRVVRFMGRDLPYIERMAENYWGMSELEHVYTELNKRDTTSENIAQLIFQANIRTYKMADLGQMLATTQPEVQKRLYQTMAMQNFLLSNMGMNVMDKEDSLETHQYTFAGINDIYESFMMDIAGAAEIPVTRLFGRSPAGLNSTGESDLVNYYDKIRQSQESLLRPILEKLLPVVCMSVLDGVPDDLEIVFNPVRDTSEQERAGLIQQSSAAIVSVFQSGLISQKTALKELRQSGASYGMWSNITDEDIENADDMSDAGMDEVGMSFPSNADVPDALDYEGQKRENNGQFGTGKKNGGSGSSSVPSAKSKSNYASFSGKTKKHIDEFSNAISSGKANLRESGMNAHMPGTREYREHAALSAVKGYKPSVFSDGYERYVPSIIQALKDRNAIFTRLHDGQISAKIDFGADLGTSFAKGDNKGHSVHAIEVRFSREGKDWHFYPCDMEDE